MSLLLTKPFVLLIKHKCFSSKFIINVDILDVFDCFFRFLAPILEKELSFPEEDFWKEVALCIHSYQEEHPELQSKFDRYDLFVPEFDRCCLNRLQLKNTQQMLNLADPMASLILEGTLENPIAQFKNIDHLRGKEEVAIV